MTTLNQLKIVTEKLQVLVEQPVTVKNRDQQLEQIEELLDQRADLIKKISPPFSEDEMKLGASITERDKEIQLKLNHHFLTLKNELRDVKKHKGSTQKYLNPYRSVASNDGSYWDKKK